MAVWCLIIVNQDGKANYLLGQKMLNSNSKDEMFYTTSTSIFSSLLLYLLYHETLCINTDSLQKIYYFFPTQRELSFQLLKERCRWKTEKKIVCQPTENSGAGRCRNTCFIFYFAVIVKGFISAGVGSENPLISNESWPTPEPTARESWQR